MKTWIAPLALGLSLFAAPAVHAADAPATGGEAKPESRMAACNKDAGERKGDERKAFMKECLSAKPQAAAGAASSPRTAQQTKMKTCNAEAKGKTGDERKAFMKECLSRKV